MDLRFENLKKIYGEKTVLDIPRGGFLEPGCTALVGPNGAGKSTLLQLVAGLDRPTEGTVLYGEKGQLSADTPYQKMTLVFQNPCLISTSVEKNIAYPLKLRGWSEPERKRRVAELMEELGLTALAQQKTWKLSGGERQKVSLARALSFRPGLLLLDEPTANIDPGSTFEIEEMLRKIMFREGTRVLIVTHDLSQARRLSDQTAFLLHGRIIEQGPTERLLTTPGTPQMERFARGELLI